MSCQLIFEKDKLKVFISLFYLESRVLGFDMFMNKEVVKYAYSYQISIIIFGIIKIMSQLLCLCSLNSEWLRLIKDFLGILG